MTEESPTADAPTVGASASNEALRVRVRGLTKRYGPILANDAVDLDIARGGIHAIVGENGAGKTTLMRALYGLVEPDAGTIELNGLEVKIASPAHAIRHGIGMVHQRFELVDQLAALENLCLGALPRKHLAFDRRAALSRAQDLSKQLGTTFDWTRLVGQLTVGARQRLEIMRLLYRDADILIFDEPTSVLTPQEADDLFAVVRRLSAQGKSVIFVTHKLREVFALAQHVTVMRRGRVVASLPTSETDPSRLASLIVGEQFERPVLAKSTQSTARILEIEGLTVCDDLGSLAVAGASFVIHAGEIVGVAGIEGSGQRELVEALIGLRRPLAGSIKVKGRPVGSTSVWSRRKQGLAYISEDRDSEGSCLAASVAENVFSINRDSAMLTRGGRLNRPAILKLARLILKRFDVRGGSPASPARALSGGNLQRLVLGRELNRTPEVLVAAHPTRGVDVRGINFIHKQLAEARRQGTATLLVSEELGELIELCDRVLVMFEGRIVADLAAATARPEQLGMLMTGAA